MFFNPVWRDFCCTLYKLKKQTSKKKSKRIRSDNMVVPSLLSVAWWQLKNKDTLDITFEELDTGSERNCMLSRPLLDTIPHTLSISEKKTQLDHSLLSLCNAFFFLLIDRQSCMCLCSVEGLSFLMTSLQNSVLCLNLWGGFFYSPFQTQPKITWTFISQHLFGVFCVPSRWYSIECRCLLI